MNSRFSNIRLIAFDADDTLWENQSLFDNAVEEYCLLLSDYGSKELMYKALYETECKNMSSLGYGTKAFVISLVENIIKVSGGKASNELIQKAISIGRKVLENPAIPLEGVVETLARLSSNANCRMVVFTKGDPLEQELKIERSGLAKFFNDTEVVSDKTPLEYMRLCNHNHIEPRDLLMVGNSFKSDIDPVLTIGGYAALVPCERLWEHERVGEYEHDNLIRLERFTDLLTLF